MVNPAVLSTVNSSVKFKFRIIASDASYTDIEPKGAPIPLRFDFNRSDQLAARLRPEDVNKVAVDLDLIREGDFVEFQLDNEVSHFGRIFTRRTVRLGGVNRVEIESHDLLGDLDNFQINQHIFQEYDDLKAVQVFNEVFPEQIFFSLMDEGIKPLAAAEVMEPFGVFGNAGTSTSDVQATRIAFNTTNNEERMIIIFRPKFTTIEKLWLMLSDFGGQSNNIFLNPVQVSLQNVTDGIAAIPLDLIQDQSGSALLKTRSGSDAIINLTTEVKEPWDNATDDGTVLTQSRLNWATTANGTDTATIITAAAVFNFGSQRFCRLTHNSGGGNNVSINTTVPGTDPDFSASGWVTIQVQMNNASVNADIDIHLTDDIVGARVRISGGNVTLHFGDSQTNQFITGYSTATIHTFYFRIRPKRLEFDFEFHVGTSWSGGATAVGVNFPVLNFTSFTSPPARITEYTISANEIGVNYQLDIGWVDGNEIPIGLLREGLSQVDFSDDPVDVEEDQYICLVVRAATSQLLVADHINWAPVFANLKRKSPEMRFLRSNNADAGVPVWAESISGSRFEFPFLVEYAETFKRVFEGRDFIIDYDLKRVFWNKGSFRAIVAPRIYPGGINGSRLFDVARISEYRNPSTNGIIETATEMRLPSVVKFVGNFSSLFTNIIVDGNSDGMDDNDGVGFNTSAFAIPVYIAEQASALQIMRNLSDEYNAIIYVTASQTPDLHFELTKQIVDIDINSPGVHEFVLSMERNIGSADAHRVKKHNVGPAENEVRNIFPVFGAKLGSTNLRIVKKNHPLIDIVGEKRREPETFPNETTEEKLWKFGEALDAAFGIQLIEGDIEVTGYWPPAPTPLTGKLDINGIIRLIDSRLPNGLDVTGTNNVFKIQSLSYNGIANKTTISVSNRNLHRFTEERLDELRNLMNGIQPTKPTEVLKDKTVDKDTLRLSFAALTDVYMALFVDNSEIETPDTAGYNRIRTSIRTQTDGYISFTAAFPENVGNTKNARFPVDEIRLFDDQIAGIQLAAIDMSADRDKIYKFETTPLHMIVFIADEDVFGPL